MIYAIVPIVILIVIIVIYVVRVTRNAKARHDARHQPDPERALSELGPRPTFVATARDISSRVFASPMRPEDEQRDMRDMYNPYRERANSERREAVVREADQAEADPELPSYHDKTTTVAVPPSAYSSPIQSRREGTQPTMAGSGQHDAPPKYQSEAPVVRVI